MNEKKVENLSESLAAKISRRKSKNGLCKQTPAMHCPHFDISSFPGPFPTIFDPLPFHTRFDCQLLILDTSAPERTHARRKEQTR